MASKFAVVGVGAAFSLAAVFVLYLQHQYFAPTDSNRVELALGLSALGSWTVYKVGKPRIGKKTEQERMQEKLLKTWENVRNPNHRKDLPNANLQTENSLPPFITDEKASQSVVKDALRQLIIKGGVEIEAEAEGMETFDLGGLKITLRGKALPIKLSQNQITSQEETPLMVNEEKPTTISEIKALLARDIYMDQEILKAFERLLPSLKERHSPVEQTAPIIEMQNNPEGE